MDLVAGAAQKTNRVWKIGFALACWSSFAIRDFRLLWHGTTLARRQEEISFDAVLLRVKLEVAAACGIERFVSAAFDDSSCFDHQDLISAPYGGEAVGYHEM